MKSKVKEFIPKIKMFFVRYGLDAIFALILWTSPSWLSIFIPGLKEFALIWLGLIVSPIIPSWLFVPILAVIIHWIRVKIWKLILYIRDQLDKLKMTNELLAYVSRDELKIVLSKFKQIGKFSKQEKDKFFKSHNEERIKRLKGSWEDLK